MEIIMFLKMRRRTQHLQFSPLDALPIVLILAPNSRFRKAFPGLYAVYAHPIRYRVTSYAFLRTPARCKFLYLS